MVKGLKAEDILFVLMDEMNCGFPYGVCTAFHSAFNRSEENAQAGRREVSGRTIAFHVSGQRAHNLQEPALPRNQARSAMPRSLKPPGLCRPPRAGSQGRSLLTIELTKLPGSCERVELWYKGSRGQVPRRKKGESVLS